MHAWQTASGVFFFYVLSVAALMPGLAAARRKLAMAGAIVGLIGVTGSSLASYRILDDWVVPPALLLIAYWTSGLLFVRPMPRAEQVLHRIDRVLCINRIAATVPRAVAELLELAYLAVYPIIPIALGIHLTATGAADAGRFWAVILVTDCVCFGMLPWIQTRPPRALEPDAPWTSSVRALNLRLLGKASIQANTFPSGHAAEALAAALLVAGAPGAIVVSMCVMALSISAGAVLGRYHYAADAVAGWAVALLVWTLVM